MAIGDCFAVIMGTAASVRQPSSGVFEQVSSLVKEATTDAWQFYDGSNLLQMVETDVVTGRAFRAARSTGGSIYNMRMLIGNTVYLRKIGSTDAHCATGVQVDT